MDDLFDYLDKRIEEKIRYDEEDKAELDMTRPAVTNQQMPVAAPQQRSKQPNKEDCRHN